MLRRVVTNALNSAAEQSAATNFGLSSTIREGGLANLAGTAVFVLVLLPIVAMVLQSFGLTGILTPIQNVINQLLGYAPQLLGSVLIFIVGFIIARVVCHILTGVLQVAGSERLAERLGIVSSFGEAGLAGFVTSIVFVLILLLVIISALQSFGPTGVLFPVQNVLTQLLVYVLQLLAVTVILVVGVFVARLVYQILINVLHVAGSEKLASSLSLGDSLGASSLASLVSGGMFVLIMVPVIAAALQPLGLESVTQPMSGLLQTILRLLPRSAATTILLVVV